MRIAYLTTDEVNHDLARRIADDCGATLEILALAAPVPEGAPDAVLVDWDHLPAGGRPFILAALLAGQWSCPAAVHGYHLEDKVRDILGQKGVAVHRRLELPWLVRWLRRVGRRADGKWLATTDANWIPANVNGQRTESPERRTLGEKTMTATGEKTMTTTYFETDRSETWTPPAR